VPSTIPTQGALSMPLTTSSDIERVVKIVLLDEAHRRLEAEDDWWREHRDAQDVFIDELSETLEKLQVAPEVGQKYRLARGKLVQRVLMKKTRCHVYYIVDRDRGVLEIQTIWGAVRGRGPKL
jgi:hypothetical protein